ncbi:MAG: hypothetical protein E6X63_35535, partial [Pseudomonas aeruginosa]|nr:hypothetical protein [Pseudomonas aeruginosa]
GKLKVSENKYIKPRFLNPKQNKKYTSPNIKPFNVLPLRILVNKHIDPINKVLVKAINISLKTMIFELNK